MGVSAADGSRRRSVGPLAAGALATGLTLLALDLTFLGVVARGVYDAALGPLKRPEVLWGPALLFYAFYVAVILAYAVAASGGARAAARRGAALGLVAYGTYELTNWAVLEGWPAWIVPIDVGWGVLLTASAAVVGRLAYDRAARAAGGRARG